MSPNQKYKIMTVWMASCGSHIHWSLSVKSIQQGVWLIFSHPRSCLFRDILLPFFPPIFWYFQLIIFLFYINNSVSLNTNRLASHIPCLPLTLVRLIHKLLATIVLYFSPVLFRHRTFNSNAFLHLFLLQNLAPKLFKVVSHGTLLLLEQGQLNFIKLFL